MRCKYRVSGAGRRRYVPSDCKSCMLQENCEQYKEYMKNLLVPTKLEKEAKPT
jgi:hypothetical protein